MGLYLIVVLPDLGDQIVGATIYFDNLQSGEVTQLLNTMGHHTVGLKLHRKGDRSPEPGQTWTHEVFSSRSSEVVLVSTCGPRSELPHDPDGLLVSLPEPSFFYLLHSLVTSLCWFLPVYVWHVADFVPTSIVSFSLFRLCHGVGNKQWGLCQEEGWLLYSEMTSLVFNMPPYTP